VISPAEVGAPFEDGEAGGAGEQDGETVKVSVMVTETVVVPVHCAEALVFRSKYSTIMYKMPKTMRRAMRK
jgi:hypothetical protein